MIDGLTLARVIHVLAVVWWIGGVLMVTTVIIPVLKRANGATPKAVLFEQIEARFSRQAKIAVLLTGLSGFYMIYAMDAWAWFSHGQFWWLHAMISLWAVYFIVLFILEPLLFHSRFKAKAQTSPEKAFVKLQVAHWVLMTLSLFVIVIGVAGAHGWFANGFIG